MRAFLSILFACCAVPLAARADEARWLFVPVIAHQRELPPWIGGALDELARSAEARGLVTWPREEAAQVFERRHSGELSPISPDDVQTLERLNDSAVKSMAAQQHAAAIHELEAAARLYQRSPEELNRIAPRVVLDMCLFRARASIESGESLLDVKNAVRDCRLRIPLEIEPNMLTHTNPTLRRLLAEVSNELAASRTGRLMVRGPSGCMARIDGVDAGRLRGGLLLFEDLLLGAHRVSAVCEGVATRVYTIDVTGADAELVVDGMVDQSVHSRPYLYLNLEHTRLPQVEVEREARVIGETLRETTVVLVRVTSRGAVVLRKLAPGTPASEAQIAAPSQLGQAWPAHQRAEAIEALVERHVEPVPEVVAPPPAPPQRLDLLTDRALTRWKRASAVMLSIAGASAVTSVALHLRARALRGDHDVPARSHALGIGSLTVGMMQAAWLGVGLHGPLLRRLELRKRNAAWMSSLAAVGVVLVAAGVYPFVRARESCADCAAQRDDRTESGFLLVGHGAGLLAAPLFLAAAYYLPVRLRTRVSLTTLPGRVGVGGTF